MSEYSSEFLDGMRDRMEVSYAKYGPVRDAYPSKFNAMEDLQRRLCKYIETGNTEWLIDAANFCMIEFMCPSHPRAHFKATESHESPGRESRDEGLTNKPNDQASDAAWQDLQDFVKRNQ